MKPSGRFGVEVLSQTVRVRLVPRADATSPCSRAQLDEHSSVSQAGLLVLDRRQVSYAMVGIRHVALAQTRRTEIALSRTVVTSPVCSTCCVANITHQLWGGRAITLDDAIGVHRGLVTLREAGQ